MGPAGKSLSRPGSGSSCILRYVDQFCWKWCSGETPGGGPGTHTGLVLAFSTTMTSPFLFTGIRAAATGALAFSFCCASYFSFAAKYFFFPAAASISYLVFTLFGAFFHFAANSFEASAKEVPSGSEARSAFRNSVQAEPGGLGASGSFRALGLLSASGPASSLYLFFSWLYTRHNAWLSCLQLSLSSGVAFFHIPLMMFASSFTPSSGCFLRTLSRWRSRNTR
mmetsp:Transcript_17931/g.50529  ORF Transcript_17931/g.50529 Transcript_17931/m.50529 type:complete len:224 (+) Transcript_17931:304-975(+)